MLAGALVAKRLSDEGVQLLASTRHAVPWTLLFERKCVLRTHPFRHASSGRIVASPVDGECVSECVRVCVCACARCYYCATTVNGRWNRKFIAINTQSPVAVRDPFVVVYFAAERFAKLLTGDRGRQLDTFARELRYAGCRRGVVQCGHSGLHMPAAGVVVVFVL